MKHEHKFVIIGHTQDWHSVLLQCITRPCQTTEARHLKKSKVKVRDRVYRPMTDVEFIEEAQSFEHECCE